MNRNLGVLIPPRPAQAKMELPKSLYNLGAPMTPLTLPELQTHLQRLPHWQHRNTKLHREYKFPDFIAAFGFMSSMALYSEAIGHHPEWSNVYNRITVELTTHDAGGITTKDIDWATKAEALAPKA